VFSKLSVQHRLEKNQGNIILNEYTYFEHKCSHSAVEPKNFYRSPLLEKRKMKLMNNLHSQAGGIGASQNKYFNFRDWCWMFKHSSQKPRLPTPSSWRSRRRSWGCTCVPAGGSRTAPPSRWPSWSLLRRPNSGPPTALTSTPAHGSHLEIMDTVSMTINWFIGASWKIWKKTWKRSFLTNLLCNLIAKHDFLSRKTWRSDICLKTCTNVDMKRCKFKSGNVPFTLVRSNCSH